MGRQIHAEWRSRYYLKRANLFLLVAITMGLIGIYVHFVLIMAALVPAIVSAECFKRYNIWSLGAEGEKIVALQLKDLPNDYHVIHDLNLEGSKGNVDHMVIGENGVFLVETKNHRGRIICENDSWKQEKTGRKGTIYEGVLRNPTSQAKRNAYLINQFVSQNLGKYVWINPIIVFTNKDAELYIQNSSVPVLRPKNLCEFIKNFQPRMRFTKEETGELNKLLSSP